MGEKIREAGVVRGTEAREKRKMLSSFIYSYLILFPRQEPKMLFYEFYVSSPTILDQEANEIACFD